MIFTNDEIFESIIGQVKSAITVLSYSLPISLLTIINQCNVGLVHHDQIVERLKQDGFNIIYDNHFYYVG
jgi:hypothetical protein